MRENEFSVLSGSIALGTAGYFKFYFKCVIQFNFFYSVADGGDSNPRGNPTAVIARGRSTDKRGQDFRPVDQNLLQNGAILRKAARPAAQTALLAALPSAPGKMLLTNTCQIDGVSVRFDASRCAINKLAIFTGETPP